MGLIRGGLLFVLSSLVMTLLLAANLSLTFSLSLDGKSLQSEILSDFSDGQQVDFKKEIENNFDSLIEHCENNTNFEFNENGYVVDIPCEVVDEGPDAVVDEVFNDIIESAIEQQYPNSPLAGFSKLLFSDKASKYWMNYFYIILGIIFLLGLGMFVLTEERINFPISFGFLILISSLPFVAVNYALPLLENSILSPISILFSEAYTVFVGALILGVSLVIIGFGLKFFKFGWSFSERFGKIKRMFSRKSKVKDLKE